MTATFAALPAGAARFRSRDLDEVREWVARLDGDHRRSLVGPGTSYDYEARALHGGDTDLAWIRVGQRQRITGIAHAPILHVAGRRRHVYELGGRTIEAHPDLAVLLAPGEQYTLHSEADTITALRLPLTRLMQELAFRRGDDAPATAWKSQEIPLSEESREDLAVLHRVLAEAIGGGVVPGRRLEQVEGELIGWVAGRILGLQPGAAYPPLGIRRVREIEAWVDAHLGAPITLGALCAVAGVGDRWLESAFRRWRGQTPMQFVAARRLARAGHRLNQPEPGDTVARIALDSGFFHLGRFSIRYRDAYGESPSATLGRSLERKPRAVP